MDGGVAQQILDGSPFGPWWGFRVHSVNDGRVRLGLAARPELFRPGGVLQGGCAMTLADVAFWLAIMSRTGVDDSAVTLEQTSVFLGAARRDLICDTDLLRAGRTVIYGTAIVHDDLGALISHHTLTYTRPVPSAEVVSPARGRAACRPSP